MREQDYVPASIETMRDGERTLRGPRLTVAYVTSCPHCRAGFVSVAGFLEAHETSATFADTGVACDGECGALYDVEWEAIRTLGTRSFVSHLISPLLRKNFS